MHKLKELPCINSRNCPPVAQRWPWHGEHLLALIGQAQLCPACKAQELFSTLKEKMSTFFISWNASNTVPSQTMFSHDVRVEISSPCTMLRRRYPDLPHYTRDTALPSILCIDSHHSPTGFHMSCLNWPLLKKSFQQTAWTSAFPSVHPAFLPSLVSTHSNTSQPPRCCSELLQVL